MRALYEDGDSEDLTPEQLKALVTPSDLKAHLDNINKHSIRNWMKGGKAAAKKSTPVRATANPQLIDMTEDGQEKASLPDTPTKSANTSVTDPVQQSTEKSPGVSESESPQQNSTHRMKTENKAPKTVVAFFARGGENKTTAEDSKTEVCSTVDLDQREHCIWRGLQ